MIPIMCQLLSVLLVVVLVSLPAFGQKGRQGLGDFYSFGDNYFLEVTTHPGIVPTKGRAVVGFRLTYDLLSFRRASQPYRREGMYVATPTLYMEAIGSDGVIVDRATWRDTARVGDYEKTNSKKDFLCGSVELALRPGLYTLKYTFDNGVPGSGFTQSTGAFKMDDFYSPSPAIGVPVFLKRVIGDTLVTASVDGAALFGEPLRLYVPLSSEEDGRSLYFELQSAAKEKGGGTLRTGYGRLLGRATLGTAVASGNDLIFKMRRAIGDSSVPVRSQGALLESSTEDLPVGDYLLLLTYEAGNNSVTDSIRFKLRWVDMPLSLTRPEYAIRALYPIASDETIDRMLSQAREQQRPALIRFWEERDPTPGTAFNEAMNEYYKRVDYSFFNFKTIGQSDGAFTDRGKIYILYGPPSEVVRALQPEGPPREVWVYNNRVGRKFIFVDESRDGAYRLVEYNDL